MQDWNDEETAILKSFYPKEGNKVKRRLPGKTKDSINRMAHELGLRWNETREYNPWTPEEEDILKTYYPIEGKEVIKRLPRHSLSSILSLAREKYLSFRMDYWTNEEDAVIREQYPLMGQDIMDKLPGRTWEAIKKRAFHMGVKCCDTAVRWTEDEDLILKKYYLSEGKKVAERLPGRTVPAVKNRAVKLELTGKHAAWSSEEDSILSEYYPAEGRSVAERFPNRTRSAVMQRVRHLGL